MRSLFVIPLVTAVVLALLAAALAGAGMHINLVDPIVAGIIGSIAGMLGILPIAYGRSKEQIVASQLGLAGTILHLLSALAMSASLVASHAIATHGSLAFWLIGGYWISLLIMIVQTHRLILVVPNSTANSTIAKADK